MLRIAAASALIFAVAVRPAAAAGPVADSGAAVAVTAGILAAPKAPLVVAPASDRFLTIAQPTRPERGAVLPLLYVGLAGLNAFDAYTTTVGLSNGAREANPLLRSVAGNPVALWTVKAGATAGSIVIAERLWRQNRRMAAITMLLVSNGVLAAVSVRNASVMNGVR